MTTAISPRVDSGPQKLTAKQKRDRQDELQKQQEDLRAQMTKPLLAAAKQLTKDWEGFVERNFRWQWEQGAYLAGIANDEPTYGSNSIAQLAQYTGYSRSLLDKVVHFHADFDKELLEKIIKTRMKISGKRISWPHIEELLTVQNDKLRAKLLDDIYENDWTADELRQAHTKTLGSPRPKHAGGRPFLPPATLTGRLENFAKIGHVIVRNEKELWRNDKCGFLKTVEEMPAERISSELLQKFAEDLALADQSITAITAVRAELAQALALAREKMEAQTQSNGAVRGKALTTIGADEESE